MAETTRYDLELVGCTPEPLMAYLKALGILRLVSEQKDKGARGWWERDAFHLESTLDGDMLAEFFLREYRPTPILAPWNAGSGFYLKWDEKKGAFKSREASDGVLRIESSTTPRLQSYRDQIAALKRSLQSQAKLADPAKMARELRDNGKQQDWSKKKTDQEVEKLLGSQMFFSTDDSTYAIEKVDKDRLLRDTRSSLVNDEAIEWVDTAFVIHTGRKKNRDEASLLGSGGNIGNSDFSARFMQVLAKSIPLADGSPSDASRSLLCSALFGQLTAGLDTLAVDQFDPGRAGGANMYQGMEADPRLNPWDYILMLEGAVVLQGASSKRLGSDSSASAFPFAVESTLAGFDSAGEDGTRGEQWLPLWSRRCTAAEVRALLAEGRSEVGRMTARTGVQFARAAASLGVDRGIRQFVRLQYQKRFGDNYLANALGRADVVARESVDLLHEADPWLDAFRGAAADEKAPPRFSSALRRIDSAVFDFCRYGGALFLQEILVTLGAAERELSTAEQFRDKHRLRPLAKLSPAWAETADDGSVEFAVARALASVYDPDDKIGPLRANLEPVDWGKRYRSWAERDRAVVWNAADLATNLGNVLKRRIMDGQRAGCKCLPLASRAGASLDVVAAFLSGNLDDRRISDLVWGLALVSGSNPSRADLPTNSFPLPRAYALLKLLFLPRPIVLERNDAGRVCARLLRQGEEGGVIIRPEPSILSSLRGGLLGEACVVAARRLRASGLVPIPGPVSGRVREGDWRELRGIAGSADPRRLTAALLLPVSDDAVNSLVSLVVRDSNTSNTPAGISV